MHGLFVAFLYSFEVLKLQSVGNLDPTPSFTHLPVFLVCKSHLVSCYLYKFKCTSMKYMSYEPPAALLMKKLFSGPIASTALSPMLLNPTSGPDSMLYSLCSLSQTPSIALFSA